MKLYYYKSPKGNFGDDLNPWLWNRLRPELFSENSDILFVGIGTLINHRLPKDIKRAGCPFGPIRSYHWVASLDRRSIATWVLLVDWGALTIPYWTPSVGGMDGALASPRGPVDLYQLEIRGETRQAA